MTTNNNSDYLTRNYPPENDTTSEGGYGAPDTFSPQNQRRSNPQAQSQLDTGLIDQSLNGGPIGREIQDIGQGTDFRARADFTHEARRDFEALNPYGGNPDSKGDMSERLASAYSEQRGSQYESGGAAGNDEDAGAS